MRKLLSNACCCDIIAAKSRCSSVQFLEPRSEEREGAFGVLVECSEGGVCCQGVTETVQKRIAKACSGRYVEGRRGKGREGEEQGGRGRDFENNPNRR